MCVAFFSWLQEIKIRILIAVHYTQNQLLKKVILPSLFLLHLKCVYKTFQIFTFYRKNVTVEKEIVTGKILHGVELQLEFLAFILLIFKMNAKSAARDDMPTKERVIFYL